MAISIETISCNNLKNADHMRLTGKSHWWGAPDLPENQPYPYVTISDGDDTFDEPLTFVCQIKLSDIAEYDKENLLPHSGMLYFFAPIDYFLGEDSLLDYHTPPVVIYSPIENGLEPYELYWEGTDESIFRPAEEIRFTQMADCSGDGHIILGKPYQDEISEAHPGCISLLQIDEDERWNLRFYDCGMYYFLINPTELAARNWSAVEGDLFFY